MSIYCQKDVILSIRPQKSHEGGGIKEKGSKGMRGGGGLPIFLVINF